MDNWEYIKDFYKVHFGIEGWAVELLANLDILILCASGASNGSISAILEIPMEEVELVIKETFDFSGWESDLPCNPYKLYKDNLQSPDKFIQALVETITSYPFQFPNPDLFFIANLCETMESIEERIYDEWT